MILFYRAATCSGDMLLGASSEALRPGYSNPTQTWLLLAGVCVCVCVCVVAIFVWSRLRTYISPVFPSVAVHSICPSLETDSCRSEHWACGGWCGGNTHASLLSLWRHCQHRIENGNDLRT